MNRGRLIDVVLTVALGLLVGEEAVTLAGRGEAPAAILVAAALLTAVPLIARRRFPLPALAVTMAAATVVGMVQDARHEPETILVPMLVMVASAATYAGRRGAYAGLAITWASLLLREPGDVIVLGPLFTGAWLIGRLLRERTETVDALEREQEERARRAVGEERARIAHELHDVVTHHVTVMVMQAGAERLAAEGRSRESRAALEQIERSGRQALVELRRMLGLLREQELAAGAERPPGVDDLDELARRVTGAGLVVELRVEGEPVELSPGVDVSAYRIVQEALTNALRHAGAARAQVTLRYASSELRVEVTDDGGGGVAGADGHGLAGMRERVAVYGGRLEAGGGEGGGFAVRARLPLEERAP